MCIDKDGHRFWTAIPADTSPVSAASGDCNDHQQVALLTAGVYLPSPVFSHDQLYTAFSRVGAAADLSVFVADDNGLNKHLAAPDEPVRTTNVIYGELLTGVQ